MKFNQCSIPTVEISDHKYTNRPVNLDHCVSLRLDEWKSSGEWVYEIEFEGTDVRWIYASAAQRFEDYVELLNEPIL